MRVVLGLLILGGLLLPGCARTRDVWTEPLPATAEGEAETVLVRMESMPKAEFLKAVLASPELSDVDKKTVRDAISPDVYTHCKLVKVRRGGKLFLEIDQFYLQRELGRDDDGHRIIEREHGSRDTYEWNAGQWREEGGMEYD